jgi:hypothetical protein
VSHHHRWAWEVGDEVCQVGAVAVQGTCTGKRAALAVSLLPLVLQNCLLHQPWMMCYAMLRSVGDGTHNRGARHCWPASSHSAKRGRAVRAAREPCAKGDELRATPPLPATCTGPSLSRLTQSLLPCSEACYPQGD